MTAFNIDRFTTSGAPDLAFGTRGEITITFPQTTLGARVVPPRLHRFKDMGMGRGLR